GINIVMVALPVHPEYSLLKNKKIRERNYSLIRQFERSHHIHFLDLQNTGIVNTGDFADPIHLNHSGALKISRIVSNNISALTNSL
ncbi:MAG TPA: hypothetical protein PKJ28_09210, partial [Bacteroidales bacterium]|nr:hypothetical protein [Bacteroidales bacterium]